MIRFHEKLVFKTLEIVKKSYEYMEVSYDLENIQQEMRNANQGIWYRGKILDKQMRSKYPVINTMEQFAMVFSTSVMNPQKLSENEIVFSNLKEDYLGILCGIAMKEHIIGGIGEFIKSVD